MSILTPKNLEPVDCVGCLRTGRSVTTQSGCPNFTVVHADAGGVLGFTGIAELAGFVDAVDEVTVFVLASFCNGMFVTLDTEAWYDCGRRRSRRNPLSGRKATGDSIDGGAVCV